MRIADGYDPEKYKDWKWWIIDLVNDVKTPMISKLRQKDEIKICPLGPPSNIIHNMNYSYNTDKYIPTEKKEIKRVYSVIDPYGEEDWDE